MVVGLIELDPDTRAGGVRDHTLEDEAGSY